MTVARTTAYAPVHRRVRMDYIGVKRLDATGTVRGEHRILGLLTSKAYAEESAQIHDGALLDVTLPLVDGLVDRLRAGIDVVDVGCGHGHAMNLIADAFPSSRVKTQTYLKWPSRMNFSFCSNSLFGVASGW